MAKIFNINNSKEREVIEDNNSDLVARCEEIGVNFGCKEGRCTACMSEIIEGMENLFPRNQKEIDAVLDDNYRLMCQCKIKSGTVKIRP